MEVTSTANPRIKEVRRLHIRKGRDETGLAFIEGLRIAIEAFELGVDFKWLVYCDALLTSQAGRKLVEHFSQKYLDKTLSVSEHVFRYLSGKDGPQGLAAVIQQRWFELDEIDLEGMGIIIALDEIADPGNLGTILRTADSAGARTVILLDNCTDPYDPTSIRASMGALFNIRLVKCSLNDFILWKSHEQIHTVGAAGAAATDYHSAIYPKQMILLMGSERQGLSDQEMQACDQLVSIPMMGRSDSLNVAMATGIILYEILNQHREHGGRKE
ncbi:MAG: RNA methyltransferase [Anaerolinea sp.]|nr:RNA methyltransferase [Anaerolinea sp.]